MALDVHIASSEKKAESKRRDTFIEEDLHEMIFTKYRSHVEQGSQLFRMANYYGDTHFIGGQVKELAAELRGLGKEVDDPRLKELLGRLAEVCARAHSADENVYLFGD